MEGVRSWALVSLGKNGLLKKAKTLTPLSVNAAVQSTITPALRLAIIILAFHTMGTYAPFC